MKNQIALFSMLFVCAAAQTVEAGNNEITGFRYTTCEGTKCFVVESPKAWLSMANGSFVAGGEPSSREENVAKFQILENGKVAIEFRGDEIVSQPEISTMTIESKSSVVIVDTKTNKFEVVSKAVSSRGAR
ncbi:hypothetical protein BH10BDE1_BH10BDE1_20340 [soil metagenome]